MKSFRLGFHHAHLRCSCSVVCLGKRCISGVFVDANENMIPFKITAQISPSH